MRDLAILVLAFALVLTAGASIFAGDEETAVTEERIVPEIRAYEVNPHSPTIDGNLDDPVWSSDKIQKMGGFTQTDPDEGAVPTESTLVAVAYDQKAVYIAFWCYDSEPDKVEKQLVRRDRWSESDMISVRLDPYHDHQTGYMFTLNSAGSQRDHRIYNDGHTDLSWDGVWSSGVKMQPWGWSAELEIPYHCLRFQELPTQEWGIDFVRIINRKAEWNKWAYVPSSEGGFVSKFGHLTGLENLMPARHLEVLPYVVSSMETGPPSLANENGRDFLGNAGVDVKYGLSSNLTLDASINPDFGQVELDRPVLNLSTYETWFSERRPFFLEGADLFETEYTMFYSRRIGRSPTGSIDDEDLYEEVDRPRATTILGAAKLSGKLGAKTSIAILGAVTDEEQSKYAVVDSVYNEQTNGSGEVISADTSFSFRRGVVEPQAGYTVVRLKRELMERSSVGLIFTLASQDTYHPAMTGGFDWRLFTNDSKWYFKGQTLFSRVDPEHTGFATDLTIGKNAGEHVRGSLGITIKDPHLHINRLGYTSRNNVRRISGWVQYRTSNDWWIIRNSWNNVNFWYDENYAGAEISKGGNVNSHFEFTNNWTLGGGVDVQAEKYSDRETRGLGLWEWPQVPTYSWWAYLDTDQRKMISLNLNPGSGSDRGGSWWAHYTGVQIRPRSDMEFEVGVNYTRNFKITRWVENVSNEDEITGQSYDTSVFADMDRDQVSLSASASLMVHRNLSCQISAQGLISGIDYRNYRPYLGSNEYGPTRTDLDHDFTWGSLNSTLLVRWEYRPGSTLYLVWTRSKSDFDNSTNDLDISRDMDRFFSAGSENLFLIKASYWLNI